MLLAGGTVLAVTALACWFVIKDEQEDKLLRQYALDREELGDRSPTPQS